MSTDPPGAIEVFFAYVPKDEVFAEELGQHLDNLQWQGLIAGWYGRDISSSEEKAGEIEFHLAQAAIVLFLVSSSFINSAYCYGAEMKQIMMRREESRNVWVIPVIVRPCDWRGAPFANLLAVPSSGKAVSKWSDRDEAFIEIMRAIREVLRYFAAR